VLDDTDAAVGLVVFHDAVLQREEGPVATDADILAGEVLEPRWRTMMPPARTTSPPKSLIPSRFDLLERPLDVEL